MWCKELFINICLKVFQWKSGFTVGTFQNATNIKCILYSWFVLKLPYLSSHGADGLQLTHTHKADPLLCKPLSRSVSKVGTGKKKHLISSLSFPFALSSNPCWKRLLATGVESLTPNSFISPSAQVCEAQTMMVWVFLCLGGIWWLDPSAAPRWMDALSCIPVWQDRGTGMLSIL